MQKSYGKRLEHTMGCGSSKGAKVKPNTKDNSEVESTAGQEIPDGSENVKEEKVNDEVASVVKLDKRATSFVIGYEEPKISPKKIRTLEQLKEKKKKQITKEELEEKQRRADERRQAELKNRVQAAEENDRRREEIVSNTKSSRLEKAIQLDKKLNNAASKRDQKLEERKKAGVTSDRKGQQVRARRHQAAIEEASNLEVGGEESDNSENDSGDNGSDGENNADGDNDETAVELW